MTFRRCYTPSPWTPPAHGSLFTGLLPSGHGLREAVGSRVRADVPLLAATLRSAGYRTVALPANPVLAATGLLEGFETVLHGPPEGHRDPGTEVAARLEGWIQSLPGENEPRRPFFLFVNLMDCHLPLAPARQDLVAVHGPEGAAVDTAGAATSVDGSIRHMLGAEPFTPAQLRTLSMAYDGGIHAADRATGRILDLLRRRGLYEETMIAVAGDHGECLGEHGDVDHHLSIHDAVLRVPLVIRWPGRFEGGRAEDAQVRLQDLYPTILEAAGLPVPAPCGRDAASLLEVPLRPREAVAEHLSFADSVPTVRRKVPGATEAGLDRYRRTFRVVREAATGPSRRKLVATGRAGEEGERLDLFDLEADPGEDRSLLGPGERPADRAAAEALRARAR